MSPNEELRTSTQPPTPPVRLPDVEEAVEMSQVVRGLPIEEGAPVAAKNVKEKDPLAHVGKGFKVSRGGHDYEVDEISDSDGKKIYALRDVKDGIIATADAEGLTEAIELEELTKRTLAQLATCEDEDHSLQSLDRAILTAQREELSKFHDDLEAATLISRIDDVIGRAEVQRMVNSVPSDLPPHLSDNLDFIHPGFVDEHLTEPAAGERSRFKGFDFFREFTSEEPNAEPVLVPPGADTQPDAFHKLRIPLLSTKEPEAALETAKDRSVEQRLKEITECEEDTRANPFKYYLIDRMDDRVQRVLFYDPHAKGEDGSSYYEMTYAEPRDGRNVGIEAVLNPTPERDDAVSIASNGFYLRLQNRSELEKEGVIGISLYIHKKAVFELVHPDGNVEGGLKRSDANKLLSEKAKAYQSEMLTEFGGQAGSTETPINKEEPAAAIDAAPESDSFSPEVATKIAQIPEDLRNIIYAELESRRQKLDKNLKGDSRILADFASQRIELLKSDPKGYYDDMLEIARKEIARNVGEGEDARKNRHAKIEQYIAIIQALEEVGL